MLEKIGVPAAGCGLNALTSGRGWKKEAVLAEFVR
jgi:hypothetical protein